MTANDPIHHWLWKTSPAHDLAGYEAGGFNDPYVRVTLLPEVDTRVRQTPVHRNEANPFFDQHFKFPVSHDELGDKTLLLQVFDYDRSVFVYVYAICYGPCKFLESEEQMRYENWKSMLRGTLSLSLRY